MAPDGSNANRFGQTLDLEGDLLVVGARDQEVGPIVTGRVYLCERTVFATANFRTDAAGINADAYEATPATPGQTWTATIDNTGTGNYMAAVVGYRHPLELFIPQASGYYLVNPTSPGGELLGLAPAFGYGLVTFEVPVPPNSAFLGLTLSTQGGSVGTGGVTLHNAYDLTIGL